MNQRYAVGIDLGGTDIKSGLVSQTGEIWYRTKLSTQANSGAEVVAAQIAKVIAEIVKEAKKIQGEVIGAGVGSPGLINFDVGIVHFSPNFAGWHDIPLAKLTKDQLKALGLSLPIFIENDVNAMTLGELMFGAGVGAKNMVCMTLGTGVGGGVVIDGKVYHGSSHTGGEIGHITIFPDGRRCGCGNYGCLEAYAGSANIVDRAFQRINSGQTSLLTKMAKSPSEVTPKLIYEAAVKGDELAKEILAETGRYIGIVLGSIANFLNPELAVIGGGIAEAGEEWLFRHIREEAKRRAMDVPAETMKIVKAKLGNEAGVVGSAMLAFNAEKERKE
jgi:glucokinase